MGVDQQQSTNNGTIRDNVIQLLRILEQGNLDNKIDYEEADKLVNGIISASKDDAVEPHRSHRSKRGLLEKVIKVLQKVDKASLKRAGKKTYSEFRKLMSRVRHEWNKLNKETREFIKDEIMEEITDYLDDYFENNLYNKTQQEATAQSSQTFLYK